MPNLKALQKPQTTPLPVELNPGLEKQVKWLVLHMYQSLTRKIGETVSFVCGHVVTEAVMNSLPGSTFIWNLNSNPIVMDPSRILFTKGNLDITDLTPGDTGVYTCIVQWGPERVKQNITAGIYSLEVTTETPTRYVFENDPLYLRSYSTPLGRLFVKATRYWLYNGTENVNAPRPTLASNVSKDLFARVTKAMAGAWQCQVMDPDTNRTWNTAWYYIGVEDAPTVPEKAYRSMLDHRYITFGVGIVIVVLMCACFAFAVYKMKKSEDSTDKEFLNTRNGWEETFSKFGADGKVKIEDFQLPPKKDKSKKGEKENAETGEKKDEDEDTSEDRGEGKKELSEKSSVADKGKDKDEEGGSENKINVVDRKKSKEDTDKDDVKENSKIKERKESAADMGDADDEGKNKNNINESAVITLVPPSRVYQKRMNTSTSKGRQRHRREDKENTRHVKSDSNESKHDEGGNRGTRKVNESEVVEGPQKHKRRGRRKRKPLLIFPEVSREHALQWLLKNSSDVNLMDTIILGAGKTGRGTQATGRSLGKVSSPSPGLDIRLVLSDIDMGAVSSEGFSQQLATAPSIMIRGQRSSNEARAIPRPQAEFLPLTEFGTPDVGLIQTRERCTYEADYDAPVEMMRRTEPQNLRRWIDQGKRRLTNWTSKPKPWGHGDVQYTVLPQADYESDDDDEL